MSEIIEDKRIFTLIEVANSIKKTIKSRYGSSYWVKAEIAEFNLYKQSGHAYLILVQKVRGELVAQIRGNIWKDNYRRINRRFLEITKEPLKDGISILMNVSINFHPVHGLSLSIKDIDPSFTLGDLARKKLEAIEELKQKGIFDNNRKLDLPLLPGRIAVISIDTSKGYSDFISVIENNKWGYRFFHMLFPSVLQGDKAVRSIIDQLKRIRKAASHFDAVAIIRGGGGDVGLSCYDDFRLAKEVAMFPVPVLAGIGHSTNETVVQMVSHSNYITPTALAESLIQQFRAFDINILDSQRMVGMTARQLLQMERTDFYSLTRLYRNVTISSLQNRHNSLNSVSHHGLNKIRSLLSVRHSQVNINSRLLKSQSGSFVENNNNDLDRLGNDIVRNTRQLLNHAKSNLLVTGERLSLLDPKNVLKRGYSITYLEGTSVKDSEQLKKGNRLVTEFYRGKIISIVE